MSLPKKLIAIAAIAIFLSSIPFAFAKNQPEYTLVVNELKVSDHYAKPGGSEGGKPTANDYVLQGIKWSSVSLPLTVYVNDGQGLLNAVAAGTTEWDTYTKAQLFKQILSSSTIVVETDRPDLLNEVTFGGQINGNPDIIAVTYTWYNVRKQIVDFDIVLNSVDYTWGDATVDSSAMDVQNIVTHELGHGLGLGDLYETSRNYNSATWPLQTMWGYSWNGDTIKRTIESGDQAGIKRLYGQ